MSIHKLDVLERSASGSNAMRQLRKSGEVPGVLYGMGRAPRLIQLQRHRLEAFLRDHQRMVQLSLGGKTQPAFLKDLQFDPLSDRVLHADFVRVDLSETLTLSVPVVYAGVAKGQGAGGRVDHHVNDLEVECLPDKIPEEITVNVAELDVGVTWHAKDLDLPDGVKPVDPEVTVVGCVLPTEEPEAEEPTAEEEAAEPEVVGKEKSEEEEQ